MVSKSESHALKQERFKRVAGRRVKEILVKFRLLKNCAKKGNYVYTNEQVDKIVETIDLEWKKVKSEFRNSKSGTEEFSL